MISRRASVAIVSAVLLLGEATAASAHNHLANPSGFKNQSGDGVSPGNSGETNLNPGGKPVANAKAFSKGNGETAVTKP